MLDGLRLCFADSLFVSRPPDVLEQLNNYSDLCRFDKLRENVI